MRRIDKLLRIAVPLAETVIQSTRYGASQATSQERNEKFKTELIRHYHANQLNDRKLRAKGEIWDMILHRYLPREVVHAGHIYKWAWRR